MSSENVSSFEALQGREGSCSCTLLDQRDVELQQVLLQLEEAQDLLKAMKAETGDRKMSSESGLEIRMQIIREHSCRVNMLRDKNYTANQIHLLRVENQQLKVAQGSQTQITAKRQQIDFLQVQIQMLEESVVKLRLV